MSYEKIVVGVIDRPLSRHYQGMQNVIDREALFASFSNTKSDNMPSREKLMAASEEDVVELAEYLAAGDGPRFPKLLQRSASFF